MDLLRSCYSTKMRFFQDNNDECDVLWYWCAPDALAFPHPTIFNSSIWDSQKGERSGSKGEFGAPHKWVDGQMPLVLGLEGYRNFPLEVVQDPVTKLVTIRTGAPNIYEPGSEVFFAQAVAPPGGMRGPLTVYELLDDRKFVVYWPYNDAHRYSDQFTTVQPVVWGKYLGKFFLGDSDDYQEGCKNPLPVFSGPTSEYGLSFAGMNVPKLAWLTVVSITNPFPTGARVGDVFTMHLRDEYPYISFIVDSDPIPEPGFLPVPFQLNSDFVVGGYFRLEMNSYYHDFERPDYWTADQQTFFWFQIQVFGSDPPPPGFPPPPDRQEQWYAILTFYDPRLHIPPAPYPMFPNGFFPPGYWPPDWN